MKTKGIPRSVDHYLSLGYPTVVTTLASEDGGGFVASIPLLGARTFVAVGETREEALQALDELKVHLFQLLIDKGSEIPEPADPNEEIGDFSGSLMLRIPRNLHQSLVREAKRNHVSVNKLATQFLAEGLGEAHASERVQEKLDEILVRLTGFAHT